MCGWIKLHRSMLDWEWYDDPNTMRVFLHCLLKANHTTKKWRGVEIKRGQFLSSYEGIGLELKLSRQKVRTAMDKLALTNEVTNQSNTQSTMFTVVAYDSYQEATNDSTNKQPTSNQPVTNDSTNKQPTSNQPVTNEQPTDNQRVTTTKNDKKEKNVNNEQAIKPIAIGKPPAKKKFNNDDVRFAEWFYSRLISINPNHKKPNFESSGWADAVRLMREQDNRTYDEMGNLFSWVVQDSFWKSNILSPKKLREKWDALKIKSMEVKQPNRSGEGREINSGNIAALVENVKTGNKRF